jgi:uncharacterized protein (DUF433 family)
MDSKLISETVGGEAYEYVPLGTHIVRAVGVCGGRPTFKYTRIEIAGVLDRIADGESVDEIAHGFAGYVSREAVAEAVTIASRYFSEMSAEAPLAGVGA